ncbi:MAG: hypothetical protein Q4Q62_04530 [Thermoplasmata archaeon]|nr:hypothetical protein [Thermoplasmata archaeon]
MFLAIDGLDGSGKSSAAETVAEALRAEGFETVLREHPGGTLAGRACRRLLLCRGRLPIALSAAFLFVDMAQTARIVRRSPPETVVIAVRYDLSSYFLSPRPAAAMHAMFAAFMPMPDLDILIDVDPSVALERVSARGESEEVFENRESMERARAAMLSAPGVTVVDGNGSRSETSDALLELVRPLLGRGDPLI